MKDKIRVKVYDDSGKPIFDFKEEPKKMKKNFKLIMEKFK